MENGTVIVRKPRLRHRLKLCCVLVQEHRSACSQLGIYLSYIHRGWKKTTLLEKFFVYMERRRDRMPVVNTQDTIPRIFLIRGRTVDLS